MSILGPLALMPNVKTPKYTVGTLLQTFSYHHVSCTLVFMTVVPTFMWVGDLCIAVHLSPSIVIINIILTNIFSKFILVINLSLPFAIFSQLYNQTIGFNMQCQFRNEVFVYLRSTNESTQLACPLASMEI